MDKKQKNTNGILIGIGMIGVLIILVILFGGKTEELANNEGETNSWEEPIESTEITESAEEKQEDIIFPDLVGKYIDEAATLLAESDLLYDIEYIEDKTQPTCYVLEQKTEAGTIVEKNSWHTLVINSYVPDEAVTEPVDNRTVPNVIGRMLPEALERVGNANCHVTEVLESNELPEDCVIPPNVLEGGMVIAQEGDVDNMILTIYTGVK